MQQRKIIIFLIILFILSSAYLSFVTKNYIDPDYEKNWWTIYFENPKSDDLNFIIENHSDKNNFHYVVLNGNDKIEERDIVVNKGETKKIKPAFVKTTTGKVTIQVISGEEKKEIYKNIGK